MVPQGTMKTMHSADVFPNFDTNLADAMGTESLSVALVGPDVTKRTALAKALAETRRASVREFDSYPPELDHLHRLLSTFDVVILDLDSDPTAALSLVESASPGEAAKIIVYSEKTDPKLAIRFMHAGAREYLLMPLERGAVAEALDRTATLLREAALAQDQMLGKLHVFAGSKGGSGVTTVACNVAIALAQRPEQKILLIDLALPIGDAALCLGIAAEYSTEDALRNIDGLDASLLESLLVKHRSGVFVLAAPTKVPEVEVSKDAINKLVAVARHEFHQVIVDVGSRIDVAAKTLFEDASTIYLVTQTGISDLRNANRLISQFFADGNSNLEIVINRTESRFREPGNDDVITKALGRPVRWKIPDDQDAARALQYGDTGQAEAPISQISLEMASSISGFALSKGEKPAIDLSSMDQKIAQLYSGNIEAPNAADPEPADTRATPIVMWATPEAICYGERLTSRQLNATASVAGSFVYTPGMGYLLPVGTHTLWVTFTPADAVRFAPVQSSVSIAVTKATPVLSWPTPEEITFGVALSETQLNASASVEGSFEYSPALGEMLSPGAHTLSVTFTPADSTKYGSNQASVALIVGKAKSAIQWPKPDPITYGTQLSTRQLCAAASIAGKFEYKPDAGAMLAVGEHRLSVVFTPEDTLDYSPSQSSVSLTVAKATPAITWPTPDPIPSGAALSPAQLNARVPVPGSFAYTPSTGEILTPGVHELSVVFTPTDSLNYTTVRAGVSVTVTEKLPSLVTWPFPGAVSYGTALDATQLNASSSVPGTFVYTPSAGHVLAPGRYTLSALFTPSDTETYAPAEATVELEVEGIAEAASSPNPGEEALSESTFTSTSFILADSLSPVETGEQTAAWTSPHETRKYKGAIYEKGDDGQWHLKK